MKVLFWLTLAMGFMLSHKSFAREVMIFIPGYYGSRLIEEKTESEVFFNLWSLFFAPKSLEMDFSLSYNNSLKPNGLFDSLKIIPGLYSIDGYGETHELLKTQAQDRDLELLVFSYDWRKDPISILKDFEAQLVTWEIELGQVETTLVAHSMGAWLMGYWLRYGSKPPGEAEPDYSRLQKVKRVLLVAAPFRGTLAIFRNLFFGAPGLPSSTYLGPRSVSSFPSSYYLTPDRGIFFTSSGDQQILELKNFQDWETGRWGALQFSQEVSTQEFVSHHLTESKRWYQKLHAPLSNHEKQFIKKLGPQAKVLVYIGEGTPTNDRGVILKSPVSAIPFAFTFEQQKTLDLKFKIDTFVDGDETISKSSAQPPGYLVEGGWAQIQYRQKRHLELLKSEDSINWDYFFQL